MSAFLGFLRTADIPKSCRSLQDALRHAGCSLPNESLPAPGIPTDPNPGASRVPSLAEAAKVAEVAEAAEPLAVPTVVLVPREPTRHLLDSMQDVSQKEEVLRDYIRKQRTRSPNAKDK